MSIVSVSRRAGPPHFGQVVLTNSSLAASGELALGRVVVDVRQQTGSWSSGTGTMPHSSQ